MTTSKKWEIGAIGGIGILIGGICMLVAIVGIFNTAFDLHLALGSYGTSTPLPNHYDEAAGLFAAGLIIVVLSAFGSFVLTKFAEAKGKPLVRVGIVVAALALLGIAGRGVQVIALKSTYGSMLAYYATDGDIEDVQAELKKKPAKEDLDHAVSRAAQYNNAPALKLLLEAGADLLQSTRPEKQRRCLLFGRSYEFIKTAIDHGVKAETCPHGEWAVYEAVQEGKSDADVEKIVRLLIGAGFPSTAKPEYETENPLELANSKKWTQTVKALHQEKP